MLTTEQFFQQVLPAGGLKILAELVPIPNKPVSGWRYTTYESIADMAAAALKLDAAGRTVYHACNGFGDWHPHLKKPGKLQIRDQGNVIACRSLYDDIDVGKPGSYSTRKEAGTAIKAFCVATGLPVPTIVCSGAGLHLYWPFTEDSTPDTWQRLANKKRVVTTHFGLKIDTSCDTDVARVLRPVGTTWRKTESRTVTCKYAGTPTPADTIESRLDAYITVHNLTAPTVSTAIPDWMKGTPGNLADIAVEYPPTHMAVIAEHCAQVRAFSRTGGESEPLWHAMAGIARHCVDGEQAYHTWSAFYDDYTPQETQEKLDNWGAGPTTCEKLKSINPDGCIGCKQTCKSPVALGLRIEDIAPKSLVVAVDLPPGESGDPATETFALPDLWPAGFTYDTKSELLIGGKRNSEGTVERVSVASPLFYVVDSIRTEDGTSALIIEVLIRGRKSRFELPTKYTAEPRTLKQQLAAYRIATMNEQLLHSYVQQQLIANRQRSDEINTYTQLGWQRDGEAFLIGTKLITAEDEVTVRVGKAINADLARVGTCKGDVQTWVRGVDAIYNRENAEPYQLAICLAFGGIFGPLMPSAQWKGIPYALTSDTSGLGKSTVCKVGLNIYCQSDSTMIVDSTAKGMLGRTSAMGTLPFLMDEVTRYVVEPKDMSDLLYALSNGNTRIGLTSDGMERARLPGWNVPVMLTGNRNIMYHVTEHALTPEAAQMRVFEVDIEQYPILATLDKTTTEYARFGGEHQAITNELIANHYGVIGEEWIRWVITHRGEIKTKLVDVGTKMRTAMYGGNASKERFYYDLATMMLVGGYFAKKLGYIDFDLNNLKRWIIKHVAKLRAISTENNSTPEDLFAHLMSDMNGKLLVTNRFDGSDLRSANTAEMDQANVRGVIEGRVVNGTEDERSRVYIAIRAVTAWCAKNGVQYTKFKRELMGRNLIRLGTPGCNKTSGCVRVRIGKGVVAQEHLGQVNCLEFDAKEAGKHLQQPAPVVQIKEVAAA